MASWYTVEGHWLTGKAIESDRFSTYYRAAKWYQTLVKDPAVANLKLVERWDGKTILLFYRKPKGRP